jgi:hypothetical protein
MKTLRISDEIHRKLETRVKGTMILKREGRFFKVVTVRGTGHRYVFECVDIDSKQRQVFTYEMLRLLEAFDAAASMMRDPKDILLVDLDDQGKWKIMTKDQIDKATKHH